VNQSLGARPPARIEPFWLRLRQILLYPLQGEALLTIAVLAVAWLVGYVPLLGFWLDLLVSVAVFKYAAEVLYRTAHGRFDAPTGYSTEDEAGWALVKTQVLLLVIAVAGSLLAHAIDQPWLAWVIVGTVAIGTPGALTSAAIDQNHWVAINPMLWLNVMVRLGWPYFVVAGLCALIAASQGNAQALLIPYLPEPVGVVVFYFIAHYATVVTFHLMGYLVHQYHEPLGFEIEQRVVIRRPTDQDQDVLDEAEALAADGNTTGAEELLGAHIRERGGSDGVHLRYRKLLRLRQDNAALIRHGREYLNALFAREDLKRAVELFRECRELDAGFWPADPDQVFRLASKAIELGFAEAALRFTSGFHRAFPRHADIPRNYLLAAKLLAERFNHEQKARELLQGVRQLFPSHPLVPEIDAYLAFIARLSAKPNAVA
jgi:tetratricopeptide (TPR) repeat protein